MSIISEWRAAYFFGRAVGKFYQKKYPEASNLFKKTIKLDPTYEVSIYPFLGSCELHLNQFNEALEYFDKVYEPLIQQSANLINLFEKKELLIFLKNYILTLEKMNMEEKAAIVTKKLNEIEKIQK